MEIVNTGSKRQPEKQNRLCVAPNGFLLDGWISGENFCKTPNSSLRSEAEVRS